MYKRFFLYFIIKCRSFIEAIADKICIWNGRHKIPPCMFLYKLYLTAIHRKAKISGEGISHFDIPWNFNILKLDGAIIGSGSIVTHGISAKALAVGRQMTVIRTNVEWK